ncbi:Internal virion protein [Sea otter poxvirus]|uniref:Internal virion protein n=1 Tax=Sea otter poxvirus TaxID=1416741 RepID=A0A2U9QHQ5_9POXV|nr:Internal virion protein [Sea otter poxvirus]AWU47107.1 Internal virion protein [Sea otter poxvirus]
MNTNEHHSNKGKSKRKSNKTLLLPSYINYKNVPKTKLCQQVRPQKQDTQENKHCKENSNFVDLRICEYNSRIPLNLYTSYGTFTTKLVSEEEANCWIELSSAVLNRLAINFPLIMGSSEHSNGRSIYIEMWPTSRVTTLDPKDYNISVVLLFQLVVALYSMYKRNIYADGLAFDILTVPKTTIQFLINQMIFSITTDVVIILSRTARLYRADLPQSCYLNYVRGFAALCRWPHTVSNYFFEWLIRNHFDYFSKQQIDIFKIKKRYAPSFHINHLTEPGTLVYVSRDDMFIVGVTLTDVSVNENVRVIFSHDGLCFSVDDFNIKDVYLTDNLFNRSQLSTIVI